MAQATTAATTMPPPAINISRRLRAAIQDVAPNDFTANLVRRLGCRLLAELELGAHHPAELRPIVSLEALVRRGHAFIAGSHELVGVLLPGIERLGFLFQR